MPSYQDIETRVRVLEDKINFTMKAIRSARKEGLIEPKIVVSTLLDLYLASRGAPQREEEILAPVEDTDSPTT